ncbi:hypothetical protein [Caproicibacter sp. BJN0012]
MYLKIFPVFSVILYLRNSWHDYCWNLVMSFRLILEREADGIHCKSRGEITMKRTFLHDCVAVLFSTLILWLVLTFVMVKACFLLSGNAGKIAVLAVGLAVCAFATGASIAVVCHLKKNRSDLYKEEPPCNDDEEFHDVDAPAKEHNTMFEIFDSLFLMLLCFLTLFLAMRLGVNTEGILNYSVNRRTLIITCLGLISVLTLIITKSDKSLKKIIKEVYKK